MKQTLIVVLLCGASSTVRAKPSNVIAEQQVRQVYQLVTQAADRRKLAPVSRYIADEAVFVDGMSGSIETKAEWFARASYMSEGKVAKPSSSDIRVQVQGNTATVTEVNNYWHEKWNKRLTLTSLFSKRKGHWKIIAVLTASNSEGPAPRIEPGLR